MLRHLLKAIKAKANMSAPRVDIPPLTTSLHPNLPNGELLDKNNMPSGNTKNKHWHKSINSKLRMNMVVVLKFLSSLCLLRLAAYGMAIKVPKFPSMPSTPIIRNHIPAAFRNKSIT